MKGKHGFWILGVFATLILALLLAPLPTEAEESTTVYRWVRQEVPLADEISQLIGKRPIAIKQGQLEIEGVSKNGIELKFAGDLTSEEAAELDRKFVGFVRSGLPESEPSRSTHFAQIVALDVTATKPLEVVRIWEGYSYYYDCFVTQDVVDVYQSGNLAVGDYVLVHFDDTGREVAMMKIYKSW